MMTCQVGVLTGMLLRHSWRSGKPGWKKVVKHAVQKHLLASKLAPPAMPAEPKAPEQVQFPCAESEEIFTTVRALQLHRAHANYMRALEYCLVIRKHCPACMKFCEPMSQFKAICGMFLVLGWQIGVTPGSRLFSSAAKIMVMVCDVLSFAKLPGMRCQEALQLCGPKPCKADPGDLTTLENSFLQEKKRFIQKGILFPVKTQLDRCFVLFDEWTNSETGDWLSFFPSDSIWDSLAAMFLQPRCGEQI